MNVGIGFLGFAYKLNAGRSCVYNLLLIYYSQLIVRLFTRKYLIAITQKLFAGRYGLKNTNSIAH
jgi:hypothetical protein